jgi:hypothetical protein
MGYALLDARVRPVTVKSRVRPVTVKA